MAKVLQINISETTGVPKVKIEKGYFRVEHGLEGDAHAKTGIDRYHFLPTNQ